MISRLACVELLIRQWTITGLDALYINVHMISCNIVSDEYFTVVFVNIVIALCQHACCYSVYLIAF